MCKCVVVQECVGVCGCMCMCECVVVQENVGVCHGHREGLNKSQEGLRGV